MPPAAVSTAPIASTSRRSAALSLLDRDRDAIADFDRAAIIRPELVYVIEARARALAGIGDSARAGRDREALARLRADRARCTPCLDPFHY